MTEVMTEKKAAPMTPAHVAVAIVAASAVTGTTPDAVFEDGNGRARVMAAAGCIARLGWDRKATARVFKVHPNRLTPSGLALARVETEHLLAVAEALDGAGLTTGDDPAARHRADWKVDGPQSAAAKAATPARKPARAASRQTGKPVDPVPVASVTPAAPCATNPVRPRPTPQPTRPRAGITPLKRVNARIVRWTRQQLGLGADLGFVADCFGVDAEALRAACEPMGMAA